MQQSIDRILKYEFAEHFFGRPVLSYLDRVSKKVATNYREIILNPMDLGTIKRKLEQHK